MMHPPRAARSIALPLILALAAPIVAADEEKENSPSFIEDVLSRPIIGPRQTLAEVQDFAEQRIPRMPEVKTADEWQQKADQYRADVFSKVIFRGEAARWRDAETKVEWLETIDGGPGYRIRKLRYEALPGLWIPALLYEPEGLEGKVPVVLNVNGHDANGKAADYKQIRCINLAKRGMLALNVEWLGMGQLRGPDYGHTLINAIDLCGTGGIATHYLAMTRGIDVLLSHEHADPSRVAVTGLSGGGWQTIFISSLDTRVTLADPVAGYSSFVTRVRHFSDLGDSEQTPCDLATVVDYAHLTAMLAPRPTLLTFNQHDNCCFAAPHALPPLVGAAAPIFSLFDREANLRFHVNVDPGDHNYGVDNRQAFYRLLVDRGYSNLPDDDAKEIPSESEVKTAEQLQVELPEDNATLRGLALGLADDLSNAVEFPETRAEAEDWQRSRREALRAIVRPFDAELNARALETVVEREDDDGSSTLRARPWKLTIGDSWTVPAVEFSRGEPGGKPTVILLADGGRAEAAERARALVEEGRRVVAIDPFYLGESKIADHDALFALMVATVGERPLGLQAGQLMATARWLCGKGSGGDAVEAAEGPVSVVALGPRTGTIALIAAALEPGAIGEVELHRPLGSLRELIEKDHSFNDTPELYCFGLLAEFDIPRIAALVAPRPVILEDADPRAEDALAEFNDWSSRLLSGPDSGR